MIFGVNRSGYRPVLRSSWRERVLSCGCDSHLGARRGHQKGGPAKVIQNLRHAGIVLPNSGSCVPEVRCVVVQCWAGLWGFLDVLRSGGWVLKNCLRKLSVAVTPFRFVFFSCYSVAIFTPIITDYAWENIFIAYSEDIFLTYSDSFGLTNQFFSHNSSKTLFTPGLILFKFRKISNNVPVILIHK